MKIVIIGGVAAGTSAAAKARRNNEEAEITIYEKGGHISYSGCGLPYYISDYIDDREDIVPRDPKFFRKKYRVDVHVRREVVKIDPVNKTLTIKDLETGNNFLDAYDKLVLATGASPVMPEIEGIGSANVFHVRSVEDADAIREYVKSEKVRKAVIVGTGYIGLEMAENLNKIGLKVTMVEAEDRVMPAMDRDMSAYIEDYLHEKCVRTVLNDPVAGFEGKLLVEKVLLKSGDRIKADMVIMAVGVAPNTALAGEAGVSLGIKGAIKVNTKMETNIPDIYACGDCIESYSLITGKPVYAPLGSTANKTGRIAGDQITGGTLEFRGILGTSIFRLFDRTVAKTGLTRHEAEVQGYSAVICHNIKPDRAVYMGGKDMIIKAVADSKTGKLLGAQIFGESGVDKRIDVLATALSFGARAEDLFHLDLAYAPPYATAKDPVHYTGMILDNAMRKGLELISPEELESRRQNGEVITILDARSARQYDKSNVDGAQNMPLETIRDQLAELDKETTVVSYCNKGTTGNAVQNILIHNGFKKVYNLSGGYKHYQKTIGKKTGEK